MEEKFIPWVYQEFPKALTVPGTDTQIIVANADEEADQLARWRVGDQDDDPIEREGLLARASELGMKIDRRWADKRLAQEIEAFETSEAMNEPDPVLEPQPEPAREPEVEPEVQPEPSAWNNGE